MQQGGGILYGGRGVGGLGGIPSAYKTVSHNTMLITIKKKEKRWEEWNEGLGKKEGRMGWERSRDGKET